MESKSGNNLGKGFGNNFPSDMPCGHGASFAPETWIILIGLPILILFGVPGNILSILVMCRKTFRTNSTSVFVITLAVCDIIYLFTNSLSNQWVEAVSCVNIQKLSNISCKLIKYIIYVPKSIGAWILVSIAAERCIVVVYPFKAKTICTLRRTKIYILLLTTFMFLLHIYIPIVMTNTPLYATYCEIDIHFSVTTHLALHTVDLVLYSFLPSVLLIILNSGLCIKLNQRRSAVPALISFSTALIQEDSLRLNVILMMISIMFLICTLPLAILMVFNAVPGTLVESQTSRVIFSSFYCLNLFNSTVNFLLYCVSGPRFRAEIRKMCEEFCQRFSRRNKVGQQASSQMNSLRTARTAIE